MDAGALVTLLLALLTFTLGSKALGETRRINVSVPDGYDAAPAARYPVLYVPDGGLEEDFPHVADDVRAAVAAGEMRPMIVVGIENTERRRDMTPPTTVESDKAIAPRVGGSSAFRAFLKDELVPEIARRYRVGSERAIVGESLAGLFVVDTFFEAPGLFDTYVALSPSLWWNDQTLVKSAAERLRSRPDLKAALYVASAGDDDRGDAVKSFAAAVRAAAPKGFSFTYETWPALTHATIYRGASPRVFRKLFPRESR
jgi:predicted alpha/beta superfamily hydrolase